MDRLFAKGGFKNVYKGKYTQGERAGEECVTKVFIDGAVYEESFFKHELEVVAKAMELIGKFNQGLFVRGSVVRQ